MRIIIIDNGLETSFGHSFTIGRALQSELRARAIDHAFFAAQDVEPGVRAEIECVPHFTHPLYASISFSRWEQRWRRLAAMATRSPFDDTLPSERKTAPVLNRSFETDLDRLPAEVWADGNIVLFTGLMQHQLAGLASFVERRLSGRSAKIICQLMFKDDWLPWRGKAELGPGLYRQAFERLRSRIGRDVFFTTENAALGDYFFQTFRVPTNVLPVPLLGASKVKEQSDRIALGFFGYSKLEKGFHLLPEAIEICEAARSDLEFTIQVQHYEEEPAIVEAVAALRQRRRVTLLGKILSEEEFARHTAAMDIVLLPYDPQLFGLRGSGIFTESVSAGRLIVASEGTWAARSIELGIAVGEAFAPYTSEAFAHAILAVCENLREKQPRAREKAAAFAARHSIGAYVDALFDVIGRRHLGANGDGQV